MFIEALLKHHDMIISRAWWNKQTFIVQLQMSNSINTQLEDIDSADVLTLFNKFT